ncbi:MAG TPA: NADP-dependent isocitrate dehydrogenase, partial [Kangiella sp.]
TDDAELTELFAKVSEALTSNEITIIEELNDVQGQPMDIGGYYKPDDNLGFKAMRPSVTLNKALELI